jgi:hypothetical protein
MKLKLDENLGELGRDVLTAKGHDVSTVAMQQMSGSRDNVRWTPLVGPLGPGS